MTISDDIAKVLDLDAKATGGPWIAGRPDMLSYDGDGRGPWKQIYWDDPDAQEHLGEKLPGIVGRMDGDNCIANAQAAAEYRTLAPRLAAWAQRVLPLVEAAERVRRLHREYTIDDAFGTAKDAHASYQAARLAEELLVEAALALNLEVPRG